MNHVFMDGLGCMKSNMLTHPTPHLNKPGRSFIIDLRNNVKSQLSHLSEPDLNNSPSSGTYPCTNLRLERWQQWQRPPQMTKSRSSIGVWRSGMGTWWVIWSIGWQRVWWFKECGNRRSGGKVVLRRLRRRQQKRRATSDAGWASLFQGRWHSSIKGTLPWAFNIRLLQLWIVQRSAEEVQRIGRRTDLLENKHSWHWYEKDRKSVV